jgi:hypothetical protein
LVIIKIQGAIMQMSVHKNSSTVKEKLGAYERESTVKNNSIINGMTQDK